MNKKTAFLKNKPSTQKTDSNRGQESPIHFKISPAKDIDDFLNNRRNKKKRQRQRQRQRIEQQLGSPPEIQNTLTQLSGRAKINSANNRPVSLYDHMINTEDKEAMNLLEKHRKNPIIKDDTKVSGFKIEGNNIVAFTNSSR